MPTYERFIFESFKLDPESRTIKLTYSLDDQIQFEEVFTLPVGLPLNVDHPDLEAALFALHLSGGASYYKTYCPKIIEIRSGSLNEQQAAFWNKLYTHGLGQFFYENQIDFRGLINFPVSAGVPSARAATPAPKAASGRTLVPFGGGKDSIVTAELLRASGVDQTLFRLRSHPLITELAGIADLPLLEVDRTLAPALFEQNQAGAYNGHVPITAHISFLTVVIGLLGGFERVVFSNERSSSYGNVDYLGLQVNHQWSKSLEAETMLRDYLSSYITTDVQYLNAIRPLSELHIAKLFSAHPAYFSTATSCNRNWVLTERAPNAPRWCGTCPKCAFSFALLAAFLPATNLVDMFGQNLYQNPDLLPLYRELWGVEGFKPFECVGTPEEAMAASYLARNQPGYTDTVIMKEFTTHILPTLNHPDALVENLLTPNPETTSPAIAPILKTGGVL